ncbi:MAG: alpha/beta fold hydrolase [Chitinophagaceae bacterium]
MKNIQATTAPNNDGYFYKTIDGNRIFIYDYQPSEKYAATIFIVTGITGINHHTEKDIIEQLSNSENRVVVIHPRGTGYSDGVRGDISNFNDFINDYSEIILNDRDYISKQHKIFLFGHSMSTAVLLAAAKNLSNLHDAILINPPYRQKKVRGMSPGFIQYIKYAWYFLFAKHKPIVNMAGDPAKIKNEDDRCDSASKIDDPLLFTYFSLYYMSEVRKLMNAMLDYCRKADYPLLLIYGTDDAIVDQAACDLIYKNWKHKNKAYKLIQHGSHGKSTVIGAKEIINKWVKNN